MVVSVVGGDLGGDRSNYLWRLRHNTARPDIVTADQPQPIDTLSIIQVRRNRYRLIHALPSRTVDQPWSAGYPVIPGRWACPCCLPDPDPILKSGPVFLRESADD